MAKPFELIYVENRAQWRKWLIKNHNKKEAWIVYYKKRTNKKSVPYDDAVEEAICFGWIDGKVKSIDEEKYMQRFSPRTSKSQWSTKNVQRYNDMIKAGRMTEIGKKVFEAKLRIYTPVLGKNAYKWHLSHKMPKSPTLKQRIEWHKGHQESCGCRPIPKSIQPYL